MKARAYPEALPDSRGTDWMVQLVDQLIGMTDIANKQMIVPAGEEDRPQLIRVHEMMHATFTPKIPLSQIARRYKVGLDALQAGEDARLNCVAVTTNALPRWARQLISAGLMCNIDSSAAVKYWKDKYAADPMEAIGTLARAIVAAWGTADNAILRNIASVALPTPAHRVIEHINHEAYKILQARIRSGDPIPPFARSIAIAKLFDQLSTPPEEENKGEGEEGKEELDQSKDQIIKDLDEHFGHNKPDNEYTKGQKGRWGTMEIVTFKLEDNQDLRRRSRRMAAADAGTFLDRIERVFTDQKVFRELRPHFGGTVLIDVSGSMSLEPEDVLELVKVAPAATVATYCGRSDRGQLRIVAENGRMASHKSGAYNPYGNGNIIDGPALHWLASQRAPRIWVSDCLVTGEHECQFSNLLVEVHLTCIRNKILRVDRPAAARDMLKMIRHAGRRFA